MKADATAGHTAFLRGRPGGWREHFSVSDERAVMEMTAARLPLEATSVAGVGVAVVRRSFTGWPPYTRLALTRS